MMNEADRPQTFDALLRQWAAAYGERPALIDVLGRMSFTELFEHAERTAAALAAAGLRPGARVAVLATGNPAAIRLMLGAFATAAVLPLDPAIGVEAAREVFSRIGVEALVTDGEGLEPVREAARAMDLTVLEARAGVLTGALPSDGAPMRGAPDRTMLILLTSGTTGRQKLIPRSQRCWLSFVFDVINDYRLEPGEVWINPSPVVHGLGLFSVFRALHQGAVCVCLTRFEMADFGYWASTTGAVGYNGSPVIHQEVLSADPALLRGWRPRIIRSGSASLPAATVAGLQARFGADVVLSCSYGLSETAVISRVRMPDQPMVPGCVGRIGNVTVRIVDEAGGVCGAGESGEILVSGPTVIDGYLDDAALTAAAFVDGWFRTGDRGYVDAQGCLWLSGRVSEVVNRGGAKVSTQEIESWLLEQPGVRLAAAFGVAHPSLGQDLLAAVVASPGETVDTRALRQAMLASRPGYQVPSRIVLAPELPLNVAGKLRRPELEGFLAPLLRTEYRAPESGSEKLVVGLMAELLGGATIGADDDFFMHGGHSLLALRLLARVREESGRALAPARFMEDPTPAALAALIDAVEADQGPHPAIHAYRAQGRAAPLFFMPGIEGHPLVARRYLPYLAADVPLFGIDPPSARRPGEEVLAATAAHCAAMVGLAQPTGPLRLAGYSFGGMVAAAAAALLAAQGRTVETLLLIDPAVGLYRVAKPPESDHQALLEAARRHDWRPFDIAVTLVRSGHRVDRQLQLPALGWEHLARGGVTVYDLPTTHFGLAMAPHSARVGEILSGCLSPGGGAERIAPDCEIPYQPLPAAFFAMRRCMLDGDVATARTLAQALRAQGQWPVWAAPLLSMPGQPAHWAPSPVPGQRSEALLLRELLLCRQRGDASAGQQALDRIEQRLASDPDLYATVGLALIECGWPPVALSLMRRAVERAGPAGRVDAHRLLAAQALADADWRAALRHATALAGIRPEDGEVYPMIVALCAQLGETEQARVWRERALEHCWHRSDLPGLLDACLRPNNSDTPIGRQIIAAGERARQRAARPPQA